MRTALSHSSMSKFLLTISFLINTQLILSQPLSGNYTIGGNGPDFNTFQEAANALMGNGVSGPVIFSIRPGVYTEQGGAAPVMMLEQAVAGVSENNNIKFQPDESAGGNVNNVILEINGGTPPTGGRTVVSVNVEYTTISNLTMRDVDTSGNFANSLLRLRGRSGQGIIREIKIIGCRFLGSPLFNEIPSFSSGSRGTVYGIWLDKTNLTQFLNIELSENYIEKSNYGIFVNAGLTLINVAIISNTINSIHNKVTGSPLNIGAGIHFARIDASENLTVNNNIIDFLGSNGAPASGISLLTEQSGRYIKAVIDGNKIINRPGKISSGTFQTNTFSAIQVGSNSNPQNDVIISNNMIAGNFIRQTGGPLGNRWGIRARCNNIRIYHNSIVNPFEVLISGSNDLSRAIEVDAEDIQVINNIIIEYSKNNSGNGNSYAYAILDTIELVTDYNVFDVADGQRLAFVIGLGNFAMGLSQLQALTGKDSNSVKKPIEFVDSVDLHLTNCQMQDPELAGISVFEITDDIDGDLRSTTAPTRGADEAVLNDFRYWSDAFHADLPGFPFSIAADKFDNLIGDNIAVPDFDNNQVLTYHSVGRSFIVSNTLSTPFKPIAVLFHDYDEDGNIDLIVGGSDPGGIKVFWGDGIGGFPATSEIAIEGAVLNLYPSFFNGPLYKFLFVPMGNLFGFLGCSPQRELCFDIQYISGGIVDTLDSFIHSMVTGELNEDNNPEIIGIGHSDGKMAYWNTHINLIYPPPPLPQPPCDHYQFVQDDGSYQDFDFQTGWYSYANSIIKGDFDGDGDLDFIATGISQQFIVYIKNEGNLNFSNQLIPVEDFAQALASLDYDNDGDLDFVTANYSQRNGITMFLNDGSGNFSQAVSCFQDLIEGFPEGIVAKDFDVDGRTDIAVTTSFNKLAVLYNVGGPTSVEQGYNFSPTEFVLKQNYPNPFNPSTTIEFSIPQSGLVQLSIYNILGEEVKQLINEEKPAGNHSVQFNASQLASGIYLYRLQAGAFVGTKKMILLK